MSPPVSLIIVTYNRERYLEAAIESLLAQTYRDFELLIWDDGSTDRSLQLAQRYAEADSRVAVIAADHQGYPAALKQAIAKTQGRYLGWVDSDDWLAPTALAETVTFLNNHADVGLIYTDYLDVDASGKVLSYGKRCRIPYSPERLLIDFMIFHFRLMRRSQYDQVGGIDDALACAEDYDLCLKLSEVTAVHHLAKPLYYYRHHDHSITQQHQVDMIYSSRDAIAHAIERRGLSDRLQIEVQLIGRFFLKER